MTPEQRAAANKAPDLRERQHLASMQGRLAHLSSTEPNVWQLIDEMAKAWADSQAHIVSVGPFAHMQRPWSQCDSDERDAIRFSMIDVREAARRIRSQRQESKA